MRKLLLMMTALSVFAAFMVCSVKTPPPASETEKVRSPQSESPTMSDPSKIDASLLALLQDRSRMEKLRNPQTAPAIGAMLPFVVEQGPDGAPIVPLFVQTERAEETTQAIKRMGGTVSTVIGGRIVARVPLDSVLELARRAEVQRIEPSRRSTLSR